MKPKSARVLGKLGPVQSGPGQLGPLLTSLFVFFMHFDDLFVLGKPVPTIIDEFLEKFQTAFDPRPFLGKMLRFFPKS